MWLRVSFVLPFALAVGSSFREGLRMRQYCYVILNNAGHSWPVLSAALPDAPAEQSSFALPQLLQEGWVPVRETPMGGGTSQLAHALILLERDSSPRGARRARRPK